MKTIRFGIFASLLLCSPFSWGMKHEVSHQEKLQMLKKLDLEKASRFLSPEVTDFARQLQLKMEENPNFVYSPNEAMATTTVSLVLFVAARTYGDLIRGNGAAQNYNDLLEVHETDFDLN